MTPVGNFFNSNKRVLSLLAIVIFSLALLSLALWVFSLNEGSKKYMAFAFVIVSLPVCIWVAALRPLVFPFAAYVFLVPFENLIDISSFGTLAKLVAAASGAAILLWLVRNRQFIPPGRAIVMWNLFLLWVALTVFWALDPIASIYYLITYTLLIVLMTAVSIMPVTAIDYQAVVFAAIAGALAASAYGIYLYHSGN
jgi:peptidoglycan/LPS O-acetylase OafA/YrhL